MSGQDEHWTLAVDDIERFRSVVAQDLLTLADLHASPLQRDVIMALWRDCYHGLLGLQLSSGALRHAVKLFCLGLTEIPTCLDRNALDALARAHREIYTDDRQGARPFESAWLDRTASGRSDLAAEIDAWQRRLEVGPRAALEYRPDHLVSELRLLAYLASERSAQTSLSDLALFMDRHLLRWVGRFANRVQERTQVRWYQGLAALTAAYLDDLRAVLERPCQADSRVSRDESRPDPRPDGIAAPGARSTVALGRAQV